MYHDVRVPHVDLDVIDLAGAEVELRRFELHAVAGLDEDFRLYDGSAST
jgi:hypothetical protein